MRNPPNEQADQALTSGPERRCILAGESLPATALVRLALGPDGAIAPDVHGRAPGRGAWIGVSQPQLEVAIASGALKRALARSLRTGPIVIPPDLAARVGEALARATLDRLGLEARAGQLLTGSDRIEVAARRGQVSLLLHASDAGSDGSSKLDQAWRVGNQNAERKILSAVRLPLGRERLSQALGRQNVVHVALLDARAAKRVRQHLDRWLAYCSENKVNDPISAAA